MYSVVLLMAATISDAPAQAPAPSGCYGTRAVYQTYAVQTSQVQGCTGGVASAPQVQANGSTGGGFLARRHDRVQARRAARHSVAIVEAVPVEQVAFAIPQSQAVQQVQYFAPPPQATIAVAAPMYYSAPVHRTPVRSFFGQRICDQYGNCYYQ